MFAVARLEVVFLMMMVSSLAMLLAAGQSSTTKTFVGAGDESKDCAQIRLQMSQQFRQTFEQKVPANYLNELLPSWVESGLPSGCASIKNSVSEFNPSSQFDKGGPLGTLGPADSIFTTSLKTKRSLEGEVEVQLGRNRQKRSITTQTDISWTDPTIGMGGSASRQKRFIGGLGVGSMGSMFGGASGPADPGAPPREVTEAEQMMNTMLMFSNFQKRMYAREMGSLRKGIHTWDKPSLSNGMYGDQYYGRRRRKRESTPLARQKRFLFGPAEPGEATGFNPIFDIYGMMAGTATDPNTGKRVEFGGDIMRNMMTNTFMSTFPLGVQPPPGKEAPEFIKNMAPIWYMNTYRNLYSPRSYRSLAAPQRRTKDGYYGDSFPGKKRKRRDTFTGEVSDFDFEGLRSKRQAGEVKMENPPANTPPKPVTFYNNQPFYGDPLFSRGPTNFERAVNKFRQILQRSQQMRQTQQRNSASPYINSELIPARKTQPFSGNYFQQVAPPVYVKERYTPPVPPTQVIPYRTFPTRKTPVDPFDMSSPKDGLDPNSQGIDPFIPNPTTTPAPTTTVPTAEPGRKKRSEDYVGENSHLRVRRADKNKGGDSPLADFIFPSSFINGISSLGGYHDPVYSYDQAWNSHHHHSDPYVSSFGVHGTPLNGYGSSSNGYGSLSNDQGYWPIRFGHERNSFGYQPSLNGRTYPLLVDKSVYHISNKGEVMYGDRPMWSAHGNSHGNSRFKRSDARYKDFVYGESEENPGTRGSYQGHDKVAYKNGLGGYYYGDAFPFYRG